MDVIVAFWSKRRKYICSTFVRIRVEIILILLFEFNVIKVFVLF